MQFRLMTMLVLMSVISVGCALLFVAPALISIPVLTIMLWLSPSFWISGVVFARGYRQAFFLGGLVAAAVPFMAVSSYSMTLAFQWGQMFADTTGRRTWGNSVFDEDSRAVLIGLLLMSPMLFSAIGGCIGVFVRLISLTDTRPTTAHRPAPMPRPHALDEVVDPARDSALAVMSQAAPPGTAAHRY